MSLIFIPRTTGPTAQRQIGDFEIKTFEIQLTREKTQHRCYQRQQGFIKMMRTVPPLDDNGDLFNRAIFVMS